MSYSYKVVHLPEFLLLQYSKKHERSLTHNHATLYMGAYQEQ